MATKKKKSEALPDYESPPVNEVVCGVTFDPLAAIKIPHYGLFWESVRKTFPLCEHALPLNRGKETPFLEDLPLPRVWLVNDSQNSLLQLQKNCFIQNWRRIKAKDGYPRFENIYKSFKENWEKYKKFISENELGDIKVQEFELSYINHIVQGEGWEVTEDIGNIMKDMMWKKDRDFLPSPIGIDWKTVFQFPENGGVLAVSVRRGARRTDNTPIFVLELSARGLLSTSDADELDDWFMMAHSWIVKGFTDLTTKEIQSEIWKRK